MSQLQLLQRKLSRLRRYRWAVGAGSATAAAAAALLWGLLLVFAVDFLFRLPPAQRAAVLALVAATVAWAMARYAWPLLKRPEDPRQLALWVERRHGLHNDFIAALQFDEQAGPEHGSATLREAVVARAAQLSEQVDVFDGESAAPLPRRAALLAVTAAAALALGLAAPAHMRAFGQRLLLSNGPYPSRTEIVEVRVNESLVLPVADSSAAGAQRGARPRALQPLTARVAQGAAVSLTVKCRGERPEGGEARLRSAAQSVRVQLRPLTGQQRLEQLQQARRLLRGEAPQALRAAELAAVDCPAAAGLLRSANPQAATQAEALLARAVEQGADALTRQAAVYFVQLPGYSRSIQYQLFLGDARTEPARIEMIPLPTVEVAADVTPPAYARQQQSGPPPPGARQLRVLPGSSVALTAESVNSKRLEEVWLILQAEGQPPQRIDLQPDGGAAASWSFDPAVTPLGDVRRGYQFELQVRDADGLALASPVRGQIRIRPDRPPSGSARVVHRVVLPTAVPVVHVQAADDFAIGRLRLRLLVERADHGGPAADEPAAEDDPSSDAAASVAAESLADQPAPGETPAVEETTRDLLSDGDVIQGSALPYRRAHPLDLTPLQLVKGDRLKITLEIEDHRGTQQGSTYRAEPLVLEISDEAGVLAAISRADEESERKLDELIKQQLGIGDTP